MVHWFDKGDGSSLNLDQIFLGTVFSITALVEGESPRNVLPYEVNTLENLLGDSLDPVAEVTWSICDMCQVGR